jgi:capsular exopolysaccharide synthesis family protein
MAQDDRLLPLTPGPLNRPLRELTQPDRPNNTYASPEPTNLRDYLQVVLKRKWLILSLAIVVTSLTAIQMYRQPSIFEAETTVQIEQKNRSLVKTPQLVINAASDPTYWTTQLKLLENPRIARKVILTLDLENNPSFLDTSRPGLFDTVRRVVSREKPKGNDATKGGELSVVNGNDDTSADDVKLTPEQAAKMEVYENYFRACLNINPVEKTSLVEIHFQHPDPQLAMKITDTLANVFIEDNYNREVSGSSTTATQIGQKVAELQIDIQNKQQAILDFKRDKNLPLSPQEGSDLSVLVMKNTTNEMFAATTAREKAEADYEAAQKTTDPFSVPAVQENKNVQALRAKLDELDQKHAEMAVSYTEEHPAMKKLRDQRERVEQAMNQQAKSVVASLKNTYESAKANEDKLRAESGRARSQVNSRSQAEMQLANMMAELETDKQMYATYSQHQREMTLSGGDVSSNISIATPARQPRLVGPPRVRNIMIALLLSLGAGIGLAFLLDYLDDTLKTIEDVDRHIHLPTLALIPAPRTERRTLTARNAAPANGSDSTALALIEEVRSPVAEAYRHLRTSLLLSSAGQPPRSILVTSSQPSEGKTTTAVNIAVMLAQTGADVLLLDCDLRRPRVHTHFQLPNARGVTNYLSGEAQVSSLVQEYEKLPNLKVITSGPVPPNAAELLGSEEMRRLLHLLSENFQHIVIDSPPAISFTDASILSTMVDGVMLVVHGGRSSRSVVRRAKQQLLDVGAHIFGIVLNNVKQDSPDYYYYGGYYSNYYSPEDGEEASDETLAHTAK